MTPTPEEVQVLAEAAVAEVFKLLTEFRGRMNEEVAAAIREAVAAASAAAFARAREQAADLVATRAAGTFDAGTEESRRAGRWGQSIAAAIRAMTDAPPKP